MPHDLPRSTSASQLSCYAQCPRRYHYRYVERREPEHRGTGLCLGSAVGGAVAWWFNEKIEGREPKLDDALAVLRSDFHAAIAHPNIDWKDETPASLSDDAHKLLTLFINPLGNDVINLMRCSQALESVGRCATVHVVSIDSITTTGNIAVFRFERDVVLNPRAHEAEDACGFKLPRAGRATWERTARRDDAGRWLLTGNGRLIAEAPAVGDVPSETPASAPAAPATATPIHDDCLEPRAGESFDAYSRRCNL